MVSRWELSKGMDEQRVIAAFSGWRVQSDDLGLLEPGVSARCP